MARLQVIEAMPLNIILSFFQFLRLSNQYSIFPPFVLLTTDTQCFIFGGMKKSEKEAQIS